MEGLPNQGYSANITESGQDSSPEHTYDEYHDAFPCVATQTDQLHNLNVQSTYGCKTKYLKIGKPVLII